MHNKRKRSKSAIYNDYASILFIIALTLIIYGFILNFSNTTKLISNDASDDENISTISITTNDGSEVVPGNTITGVSSGSIGGSSSGVVNSSPSPSIAPSQAPSSGGNNGGNGGTKKPQTTQPQTPKPQTPQPSSTPQQVVQPTIEEVNNNLRISIQNKYGITVKYGGETNGYVVGGLSTTPLSDGNSINSALNQLNNTMALYPTGFFAEIRNGGIPLTVYLINNYSNNSVTGVTDSNYSFANISIAMAHPFGESFYHESYHYIERYIFKRGGNYSAWNSLNPPGFSYGNTVSNSYSYANTFSPDAPFVNTYAQTNDAEDRASTFEYMMASSKASCLNNGTTVWRKAYTMKNMIESVFSTVRPTTTEYWERYL